MHRMLAWPRTTAVGIAALVAASVALAAPAAGATPMTMYGGDAFDTAAHVGSFVSSGRTSAAYVCTSQAPATRGNTSAALDIPQVGHVGAVTTTIKTLHTSSGPATQTTTRTGATTLFSAITFTSITTVSRVARTAAGYAQTGTTSFAGLTIAGRPTPPVNPSVDQTITLPGLATIVFNHHVPTHRFGNYAMTVIGMTITIPVGNLANLPAGTITIGHGTATVHQPTEGNARGWAFGTHVNVAGLAGSGRTAAVYLPCGGTSGGTKSNHLASITVPTALTTGADSSTSRSYEDHGSTVVRTTNSTAGLNILAGVIKADSIDVAARVSGNQSGVHSRSSTVSIAGLTINGQSHSGSAPANTKIAVPNVGTLWLNRVIKTRYGIQVRGIDLVLNTSTSGLDNGTEIIVGSAFAGVLPQ